MTDTATTIEALPKPKRDLLPLLLPAAFALLMLPLVGSASSWATLLAARTLGRSMAAFGGTASEVRQVRRKRCGGLQLYMMQGPAPPV